MIKNLAITDNQGYIEFISESYLGSVHDKTIWDQIQFDFKDLNVLADLGFQGIEREHVNAILPYKKPKGKELTPFQKQINHAIGSARVKVEHAVSGVKRLKIIRNKIRLKKLSGQRPGLQNSCRTAQLESLFQNDTNTVVIMSNQLSVIFGQHLSQSSS